MNKGAKKFFSYFLLLILIVFVIFATCFALLYLMPGTSILGFEYVYAKKEESKKIMLTELSDKSVVAFKLVTNRCKVYISPNSQDDGINIVYKKDFQGITKSIDAKAEVKYDYKVEDYSNDNTQRKSLVVSINEPSNFMVASYSQVEIYLPCSKSFEVVSCVAGGEVGFVASRKIVENNVTTYKNLNVNNLLLETKDGNNISIDSDVTTSTGEGVQISQSIHNYFCTTNYGSVIINNKKSMSADSFVVLTSAGKFDYTNSNNDATLELTNGLTINTTQNGSATVNVNILKGDLKINANSGKYSFGTLGESDNQFEYIINSNNSTFEFGNVYGFVSILGKGANVKNNVKISNLVNNLTTSNMIEIGDGALIIDNLDGNSGLSSNNGEIVCKNIDKDTSVDVMSNKGDISLTYEEVSQAIGSTKVNVFSNSGNIYLKNVSGMLNLKVFDENSKGKVDIIFCAVAYDVGGSYDNYINAKSKDINLTLQGTNDDLIFRFLTLKEVNYGEVAQGLVSKANESDLDYVLNLEEYSNYTYQYRVGPVPTSSAEYNGNGKLLINSLGTIKLFVSR